VLAVLLTDDPEPMPAAETEAGSEAGATVVPNADLDAIRRELAFERDARLAMAEQIDLIWAELAKLSADHPPETATGDDAPGPRAEHPRGQPAQHTDQKWFDTGALVDAGIAAPEAERLRERYENEQLDELYLRDVATREGWISTQRYRKEMQRLKEDLRVDLGDDDYDRVLYASGRNNRVAVDDILQNSAAETAGMRKGDVIVRYDGERVLTPRDLMAATMKGTADSTTAVDVLRGTQTLRFYVPRGPLGVRIGQTRRQPQ